MVHDLIIGVFCESKIVSVHPSNRYKIVSKSTGKKIAIQYIRNCDILSEHCLGKID